MKRDEERDSDLRELFDQTADEISAAQLTRLTARAADVAERQPGLLGRFRPRVVVPALAAALAAAVALFVVEGRQPAPDPGIAFHPAAPSVNEERQRPREELVLLPDDARDMARAAGMDVETTWEPEDEFDSLFGPPPEANLDVWLLATNELMEEGI
jgi:hypothetical protein